MSAPRPPVPPSPDPARPAKAGLHPRNSYRSGYDFQALVEASPELAAFVSRNAYGNESIDFANPHAVKALNRALLKQAYGITGWDIPARYLCPPIPGRADYLHHLADLLAAGNGNEIPTGPSVRVLDVGVGANCVYPIVGHGEYGWRFVGTDIDRAALACAQATLDANDAYRAAIELRLQTSRASIFKGVLAAGEIFDLSMCNPPFHASLAEASNGSERKWRNLGRAGPHGKAPALNFGGQGAELWCPGGEAGFVSRMIMESAGISRRCRWFTSLVAKSANLPAIERALAAAGARESRTIDMAQGQKKSRIVAWTFFTAAERHGWKRRPR